MGIDVTPSTRHTCSFLCLLPHHITQGLHPSLVDAPADDHSKSHNFLLIHPREVSLVGHWVTTLPLFSCGVISVLPLVEVGLHVVGLVIFPMHDGCLYTRECQPLIQQEEVGFGGGCMTFHAGLSLHKRGHLLQSDSPPPMSLLPTYP